MVSSIRKFAQELGSNHVIKGHVERSRSKTLNRTATNDIEYAEMKHLHSLRQRRRGDQEKPEISAPFDPKQRTIAFGERHSTDAGEHRPIKRNTLTHGVKRLRHVRSRKPKILLLREERDRFDQMRVIQKSTNSFKRYSALTMSVIACKSAKDSISFQYI